MKLTTVISTITFLMAYVVGLEIENSKLKILVHSNLGRSHVKSLFEICKVMQGRGHHIMYAANAENLKYVQEYDYPFVSLGEPDGLDGSLRAEFSQFLKIREKMDFTAIMGPFFGKLMTTLYRNTYLPFYKIAEEYKPDLIMCDFFAPACRDVAEQLKIPFIIGFQTTDVFHIVPSQTNTGSSQYKPITTNELSFWERIDDKFIQPIRAVYFFSSLGKGLNELRKQYGVPTSYMPFGRFDNVYGVANTFIGFEPANGIPPNINIVGPVLSDDHAMLSSDLKAFFDNNNRILYIAFGSNVPLEDFDVENLLDASILGLEKNLIDGVAWGLGKTLTSNFPKTITLFNETVKVADLIEGQHDKIRILKWAPQVDILKHKNTKVFISHGGLESTFEAVTSGTPIVVIPVMADQPRNAKKIENMGIGKYVDRITTTPTDTYQTIKYVIEDPDNTIRPNVEKYKLISLQNSNRKYKLAQDLEDLVALANLCRKTEPFQIGKASCEIKHLIPISTEMSFIKANNLDLYLFTLSVLLAAAATSIYICYVLLRFGLNYVSAKAIYTKAKKTE